MYGAATGLQREFGEDRVRDTPISEIMYCDFLAQASDAIVNHAAKWRHVSGGQFKLPLVVRSPADGGAGYAAQHSQNLEAWFAHVPGLKVVMPDLPRDARGLLQAAVRDDNPVVFIEHKTHYSYKGEVPAEEEVIPIGKPEVKREGNDLTLVSWSKTLTLL